MSKQLINEFYEAFASQDSAKMLSCYHNEVVFTDPAFGTLKADRAKAMWTMLCKNAQELEIKHSNVEATDTDGKAHWEATYIFSKTGRKVINNIDASFKFKDGKIISHIDHFNLHKWAKQALGLQGLLFGGTSFFKKKLNKQTNYLLDKFIESF